MSIFKRVVTSVNLSFKLFIENGGWIYLVILIPTWKLQWFFISQDTAVLLLGTIGIIFLNTLLYLSLLGITIPRLKTEGHGLQYIGVIKQVFFNLKGYLFLYWKYFQKIFWSTIILCIALSTIPSILDIYSLNILPLSLLIGAIPALLLLLLLRRVKTVTLGFLYILYFMNTTITFGNTTSEVGFFFSVLILGAIPFIIKMAQLSYVIPHAIYSNTLSNEFFVQGYNLGKNTPVPSTILHMILIPSIIPYGLSLTIAFLAGNEILSMIVWGLYSILLFIGTVYSALFYKEIRQPS